MARVKIVQDESVELLTSEIVEIAAAVRKLRAGKLRDDAVVILIDAAMGSGSPGKKKIKFVLDTLANLDKVYLKEDEE